jgi:hypothetical protein
MTGEGETMNENEDAFVYLIGTYFHQDWQIKGSSPEVVVDQFAHENPREDAVAAKASALVLLRRGLSEAEIEDTLLAMGLGYEPAGCEQTHREFVEMIVERLERALAG